MPTVRRSNRPRRKDPADAERRAERRTELVLAADRAVRREGPGVSMTAIAAEAGVTKPILYKHFGDKGGLYRSLAELYVKALMAKLREALLSDRDPRERIRATIESYIEFVDSEPEMYAFLMHRAISEGPEAQETVARFIREVAREVSVTLGEELRRIGIDSGGAEAWAHGIVGMVQLAGDWWLEARSMPRHRLVSYLEQLLWQGFEGLAAQAPPLRGELAP